MLRPRAAVGDTKESGRRVTRKAPLAHVEGESGRSEMSPTAILQGTHSGNSVLGDLHTTSRIERRLSVARRDSERIHTR